MCSGMSIELRGMRDELSVSSALTAQCLHGTYSVSYTPHQEVQSSQHHYPAILPLVSYSQMLMKRWSRASVLFDILLVKR